MSDTLEIVEITDSSINPISLELDNVTAALQNTTKTKRQLSLSDTETEEKSSKKICIDPEVPVASKILVTENESVIDDTILYDSKAEDDLEKTISQPDILEQNISIEKSEDDFLKELQSKSFELDEHEPEPEQEEEEEEEIGEESFECHESDSEEENDHDLMASALKASMDRPQFIKHLKKPIDNDEPIALDDSDDEEIPRNSTKYDSDIEHSSEYSIDNNVIGDSEGSDGELDPPYLRKATNHCQKIARKILKRSLKIARGANRKPLERLALPTAENVQKSLKTEDLTKSQKGPKTPSADLQIDKVQETSESTVEIRCSTGEAIDVLETMDVSENLEAQPKDLPSADAAPPMKEPMPKKTLNDAEKTEILVENKKQSSALMTPPLEREKEDDITEPIEKVNDKSGENSNESSRHESSLLTEIANSTKEEIFNRYVLKNTDQSPTLDEFSEELFYCLQMNNQEIEKAKQLWNEKLHVKYKIRELMDTIRRHRAVMEIETFGYKPDTAGNNSSHPIISSKSSTSSSEKQYMSTDSVSRLIQDVRASMLKRDEKHRVEELTAGGNAGDNSLASQWNSLQSNSAQGRQGQIIDVQSIINDFRQKNPQEIPRRGRRMKNSFGSGFYDNQQLQLEDNRSFMTSAGNNSHDFTNNNLKSNQSGYPEVSLHPVHNIYKNLANVSAASGSNSAGFSQRSSLLQSILTKQSTRSSTGIHQNHSLPSTSTLARLLTAPERTFQGAPKSSPSSRQSSTKVHNNGEITITPISHANRSKEYAMDDDENSMEPPLIIDEAEDFDAGERSSSKVSLSDLLCQGCKKNKAFFMCAGCSRQWYCSKECQEMAWDLHAESCMN